jgi:hypothetical protein
VTADANGMYKLSDTNNAPSSPLPVTVSGDTMISHDVLLNWAHAAMRTGVDVTLIHNVPPFSMDFYRQLVRGTYDQTGAPWPILKWTVAPSFYIRTVDQNGNPIEPGIVGLIADAINRGVPAWSAGQFTPAAIESGTDARDPRLNWINVDIKRDPAETKVCGNAQVGANPGSIVLNEGVCGCPDEKGIPGVLVMHELGHAMGFFHVADASSIMNAFIQAGCGPGAPTAPESFHSGIAYSRPRGNTDPDKDPTSATLSVHANPTEICPKRGSR